MKKVYVPLERKEGKLTGAASVTIDMSEYATLGGDPFKNDETVKVLRKHKIKDIRIEDEISTDGKKVRAERKIDANLISRSVRTEIRKLLLAFVLKCVQLAIALIAVVFAIYGMICLGIVFSTAFSAVQ